MIEVETPDGGVAEFPDGTSTDVIKNALRKKFPAPQTIADGRVDRERSWSELGIDAAKSFGTGIAQGAIGLAGMPADLGNFLGNAAGRGIDWATGATPEETAQREAKVKQMQGARLFAPPTSESLTNAVESVAGPMYKPQSTLGEYANTTGQFVAGAVAGPGGIARKAALTVVPSVASEFAGQATEGTAFEPYARVGGALVGGLAASTRGNVGTKKMLKAVEKTSLKTIAKINSIRELLDLTIEEVQQKAPKVYKKELVELLFEMPYSKIELVVNRLQVERKAASRYLRELESIGILESQRVGRETLYINRRLIEILKK